MPRKKVTPRPPEKPIRPKLLSGGNPQISKGDGDEPVQAYIAAMPDWKQDICRQLDCMIVDAVPNVRKAIRWNTAFYGIADNGWSICFHCFTRYVKLSFLNGGSLEPHPPQPSKYPAVRSLHIHESDRLDAELLHSWIRQSLNLPGDSIF